MGANGTGKTTLLRVLAGLDGLDNGSISRMKGLTAGYLPQDGLTLSGRTVFDECMTVFDELRDMEKEQEALGASSPSSIREVRSISRSPIGSIASRASFSIVTAMRSTRRSARSSPGWDSRRRTGGGGPKSSPAAGRCGLRWPSSCFAKPDLLLLDEPTNHLDLEARNWLEDYLNSYPNAFILISHDRYFLDVTVKKIAELWNKRVTFYPGATRGTKS